MATFVPKPIKRLRNVSIKVGWINTGAHPGYPDRKPSGATVAQVARYNLKYRDYAAKFYDEFLLSPGLKFLIKKDIQIAIETGKFTGQNIADYLQSGLVEVIGLGNWAPNTEEWLKFKAKHGLSLHPLIASQVMLDSIKTEVTTI